MEHSILIVLLQWNNTLRTKITTLTSQFHLKHTSNLKDFFLVAQAVKNMPAVQEIWNKFLLQLQKANTREDDHGLRKEKPPKKIGLQWKPAASSHQRNPGETRYFVWLASSPRNSKNTQPVVRHSFHTHQQASWLNIRKPIPTETAALSLAKLSEETEVPRSRLGESRPSGRGRDRIRWPVKFKISDKQETILYYTLYYTCAKQ